MARETFPVDLELMSGDEGGSETILVAERLDFRGAPKEECDASGRASEVNRMDGSPRGNRFRCGVYRVVAALRMSIHASPENCRCFRM